MRTFASPSYARYQALQGPGAHLALALRCWFWSALMAFFAAVLRLLISSRATPSATCSPCIAASACARSHTGLELQRYMMT